MPGDLVIRVRGDASQLKGFYTSVAGQTETFVSDVSRTYRDVFKQLLNLKTVPVGTGMISKQTGKEIFKDVGTVIRNVRVEADNLNDVLKVTGTTGFETLRHGFMAVADTTVFRGSASALTDINKRMGEIITKGDQVTQRYRQMGAALAAQKAPAEAIALAAARQRDLARDTLTNAQRARNSLSQVIAQRQVAIQPGGAMAGLRGAARTAYVDNTNRMLAERQVLQHRVFQSAGQLGAAQRAYNAALNDPAIVNYPARLAKIENRLQGMRTQLANDLRLARADRSNLLKSEPTVLPTGYQNLQALSPQLLRQLSKGPTGLPETAKALYEAGATFSAPVYDMERGLIKLAGAYNTVSNVRGKDVTIQKNWTASVDQSGRVIETTGRQLRGFSRIFQMITRDFQKVIEWAVATTVVYGTLRAAMQGLDIIKQLNADLTRFGTTAGMSTEQTNQFYRSLLQVAQITATPIEELVKAADDFALAIAKPGQTVEQLTSQILSLAEAVGIYTNLTGQDTVSATDQLVAVMKQFGYTAEEVFMVLNKVTAAAGGQSGAIADITKGLAVMAEAGKQAGLSVDQQIAVVKTLSQVTSKSPAEVATAFKNLVGALENPAAIKALKAHNIELISQGNTIIGVYSAIAEKVRTGEISGTEVSGLLRAISGGPRRAPDAAALLANIATVLRETKVAAGATNEAFLANARIMTTLQAKWVQFQNTLKDKTFTQFGEVVQSAATVAITALTKFLDLFGNISPQAITTAAQLLMMLGIVKLTARMVTSLASTFEGLAFFQKQNILFTINGAAAQQVLAQRVAQTNVQLGIQQQRLLGMGTAMGGKRALMGGLAGAATGAAMGAMAGGGMPQILGTGLQGLGMSLMLMPDVSMVTKVIGGVSLLAGTWLSFQQTTEESTDSLHKNAEAIIQTYQGAKEAASTIGALEEEHKKLTDSLDKLTEKSSLTREEQTQLIDLQKQATGVTLDLMDANNALADSVKKLGELMPEFKNQLDTLDFLNPTEDAMILKQTIDALLEEMLGVEFPQFTFPGGKVPGPSILGQGEGQQGQLQIPYRLPQVGSTAGTYQPPTVTGAGRTYTPPRQPIDLTELKGNEKAIKAIMDEIASSGTMAFEKTAKNFDLLRDAIMSLPAGEFKDKMLGIFIPFESQASVVAQATNLLDIYAATIEKLGPLNTEAAIGLGKDLDLARDVIGAVGESKLSDQEKSRTITDILDQLRTSINLRQPMPKENIDKLITQLAEASNIENYLNVSEERRKAILEKIREEYYGVNAAARELLDTIERSEAASESFNNALGGMVESYAAKTSQAEADFMGGDIDKSQYEAITSYANAAIESLYQIKAAKDAIAESVDLSQPFVALDSALIPLINDLSVVNGLQDAGTLTAEQLITRLFGLADVYGLNEKQLEKLTTQILKVFAALKTINDIKVQFGIQAAVDTRQAIAALQAMKAAMLAVVAGAAGAGMSLNISGQIAKIDNAINMLKAAQSTLGSGSGITKILKKGAGSNAYGGYKGSSGGGGGSSGSKWDYGELDLPEEISQAPNKNALIQQAIRNARRLQKQIPGASKEAKNDIVTILDGMKKIETVRGVREDLLRRALEDLANIEKKRLEFETKADMIRRIRVGGGDFAAIANVPVNSKTGVSLAGPNGPINVTLNLNGTLMTPAQFQQFADMVAAALKRQLAK